MPRDSTIRKVLMIGSGPIVIGQAAEFDYAGAQACRVLKEEGLCVVLVNSNPATIMTDTHLADAIYLEPLLPETLERIIEKERPDGLLAGLGGQTALNLAMRLSRDGILQKYGVRLLGSPIGAIERAEDREQFRETMRRIGQPVVPSEIANTVEQALRAAETIDPPIPWAAAAAALRRMRKRCLSSPAPGSTFRPSRRFSSKRASLAGRKSNLKPCGTRWATLLLSAPWKT